MKQNERLSDFTSNELAYLWTSYEYETMIRCGLMSFLQHVDDEPTKELLKEIITISENRIEKIKQFFKTKNCPIPLGFTDDDINFNSQRLFSDKLYLEFMLQLVQMELANYTLAFVGAVKPQLQHFYENATKISMEIKTKVKQVAIDKGVYLPPPRIPTPKHASFVTKDNFLSGW